MYRFIVATINYLAIDQPDIQFASQEVCRDMSAPDEGSWGKVEDREVFGGVGAGCVEVPMEGSRGVDGHCG